MYVIIHIYVCIRRRPHAADIGCECSPGYPTLMIYDATLVLTLVSNAFRMFMFTSLIIDTLITCHVFNKITQ